MTVVDKEVIEKSFARTGDALTRLKDVLDAGPLPATLNDPDLLRDATIQRFEFCYELMWKLFRKVHLLRNIKAEKVRRGFECIAEAGAAGWLKDRDLWERMMSDRNLTSHEYDKDAADIIYRRVREEYYPEMQRAYDYVKSHYLDSSPLDEWKDRNA